MKTKEVSRKPQADVVMECVACHSRFGFNHKTMFEQALPSPNFTVTEGLIVCPYCGNKIHCYYMSEYTRHLLGKVKIAVLRWHKEKSDHSYKDYQKIHMTYKKHFDRDQVKYKELMEERQENGKITTTNS